MAVNADEASFIMEALSKLDQQLNGQQSTSELNDIETGKESEEVLDEAAEVVPGADETPSSSIEKMLENKYIAAQYGRKYAHTFVGHTYLCLRRQAKLLSRNLPVRRVSVFLKFGIDLLILSILSAALSVPVVPGRIPWTPGRGILFGLEQN